MSAPPNGDIAPGRNVEPLVADGEPQGPALGVDYGSRRVGVALGDGLGITARPLATLDRRAREAPVPALCRLAAEHAARWIVIGVPVMPDGSDAPLAAPARELAARLARTFAEQAQATRPAVFVYPEANTSVEAVERLREAGSYRTDARGRPQDPGLIDRAAAAVLLEEWQLAGGSAAGERVVPSAKDASRAERSS